MLCIFFFFQAADGIRDAHLILDVRRVLFLSRDRDIAARPVAPECAPTAFYLPKRARRPGQLAATMTASDSAISAHAQPAWSGWLPAIITPSENQNRARTPAPNPDFDATVPPDPQTAVSGTRVSDRVRPGGCSI